MITWLPVEACDPPHGVARPDQVVDLANAFVRGGWGRGQPALVGYRYEGRVQLLSGSHRWAAALLAGLERIPVILREEADVRTSWGVNDLTAWKQIMTSEPVL
jgi:hypothetical protein